MLVYLIVLLQLKLSIIKKRDYYLAFDEDNNPYVVMLDSDAKDALRKVQEYTLK